MIMGGTVEQPTVKLMLTKTDATRLAETLTGYRKTFENVTDSIAVAQRDFLDQTVSAIQAAVKADAPAAPPLQIEVTA